MSRINFTSNFVALRKSNNLTQEKMAERLGVSRQVITNWESGRNSPDINMIDMICSEFNISMDELLYGNKKLDIEASEDKLDIILKEIASLKARSNISSLFDMYKLSIRKDSDVDIDFCTLGHRERSKGNYNKALDLYDTAAMYGDINGIISAIDLRREILELCEDNMSMYYSQLNSFASKLIEYGSIMSDVLKDGDLI